MCPKRQHHSLPHCAWFLFGDFFFSKLSEAEAGRCESSFPLCVADRLPGACGAHLRVCTMLRYTRHTGLPAVPAGKATEPQTQENGNLSCAVGSAVRTSFSICLLHERDPCLRFSLCYQLGVSGCRQRKETDSFK